MKKMHRLIAVLLCVAVLLSVTAISAVSAAAEDEDLADTGAGSITIHAKSTSAVPYIYYWNTLPSNKEVAYPGAKMTLDNSQGSGWYTFKLNDVTKMNFLITNGTSTLAGQLSGELTANTGEYWLKDGRLRNKNPELADS